MNRTLAGLLKPYNQSEVARKVGAHRRRVSRWANGQGVPQVHEIPALAAVLRIPITELTLIVANDTKTGDADVISDGAAA